MSINETGKHDLKNLTKEDIKKMPKEERDEVIKELKELKAKKEEAKRIEKAKASFDKYLAEKAAEENGKKASLKDFIKGKEKILIIIGAVIVGLAAGILTYGLLSGGPVIENLPDRLHNTDDGTIRLKVNPAIIVEDRKLTNIEFHNLNKNRDMKIFLKFSAKDKEPFYESPMIEEGKVLISDYIPHSKYKEYKNRLKPGSHKKILAQMCSYDKDGNQLNQTNYKIYIVVKKN